MQIADADTAWWCCADHGRIGR